MNRGWWPNEFDYVVDNRKSPRFKDRFQFGFRRDVI